MESWLSSEIDDSEISIQGYNVVRLDRTRHGGGLVIYVHNMFSHSVLFKGSPDFELLTLSCKLPTNNPEFYLALFFRPPMASSNFLLLDTLFSTLCSFSPAVFTNFCIIGDFNVSPTSPS